MHTQYVILQTLQYTTYMNTSIIITVIVNTSTVKVKSNCNKVAVQYSPTYESSMLYCTSNNMYETSTLSIQ